MYPLTASEGEASGSSKTRTREEAVTSSNRNMKAAPSEFSATARGNRLINLGSLNSAETGKKERERRVSMLDEGFMILMLLLSLE